MIEKFLEENVRGFAVVFLVMFAGLLFTIKVWG